jgi:hypothetical protein
VVSFPQVSPLKPCMHLSSPPKADTTFSKNNVNSTDSTHIRKCTLCSILSRLSDPHHHPKFTLQNPVVSTHRVALQTLHTTGKMFIILGNVATVNSFNGSLRTAKNKVTFIVETWVIHLWNILSINYENMLTILPCTCYQLIKM